MKSPSGWAEAAIALSDILEAENACLRATDFAAATALLAAKRVAIERLGAAAPEGSKAELGAAVARLDRLSRQNRRLLTEGIAVQGQVLGIIAGAVRNASAFGYGRGGNQAARHAAFAVSAKA